jgi:hypothetical protein
MQYKLRVQLHKKYAWINNGVRGKKSIGSFQGTSTTDCFSLISEFLLLES